MTEAVAPKTVGVIGGGRMGAGIAQVFASLGGAVTIAESGDTAAALQRVSAGLDRAHERGKLDDQDPATVLARVSTVDAVTSLPPSLDLIVEAVQEIAALKVEVLAAAETVAGESTVIASNTSSMSIAELGAALSDPGRFIGMHFFNPVPASLLVEIVRAPQTRPRLSTRYAHGCRCSAKPRCSSTTHLVLQPAGLVSVSGSKPSACSKRVWRTRNRSTEQWNWDIGIRWARCVRQIWSGWMCAWRSPNTSRARSVIDLHLQHCCERRWLAASWGARRDRVFTHGAEPNCLRKEHR